MDAAAIGKQLTKRKKLPDVRPGDTVRVFERVKEGEKTRLQMFEGLVIARKHGSEAGASITVRKISYRIGVERIFPLYAPTIEKFEIVRRAKVRRAKLSYLRDRIGKRATLRGELMPPEIGADEPEEEPAPETPPEEEAPAEVEGTPKEKTSE